MSPFRRLCLLTLVGLIVPAEGQTLKDTIISPGDPAPVSIHSQTQVQDTDVPELQSRPPTPARQPGETTQKQSPTGDDVLRATPAGSDQRHVEGPTRSPTRVPFRIILKDRDDRPTGPPTPRENTPFYYDEYTLRKRGLLIAAVLFITGIVILTSGKCRRLPQLCRKNRR
ncbi:FXYD domain-containing ion transport regulator 5 [Sorex fumeus]|uniref:FXYD domain-containing ion transport regulator 5 n=1 Tax=Sorex fumeus TaxID=62283 RepID=UPI0024ACB6E5|nr:FXYD domain-containing ion transport regulator 5 [Sorex fumeus]